MAETFISISYLFHFEDNSTKAFDVLIDSSTLSIKLPDTYTPPEWVQNFKCTINKCTLSKDKTCNLCKNISQLIEEFKNYSSFQPCTISVRTKERNYILSGDVQRGLFSLLGLYMSTSNCPFLNFLKPMAKFHLPFSSIEETTFRAIGSFFLGQYFKSKRGSLPDWNLSELRDSYKNVSKINTDIITHLRKSYKKDAYANAIVILDTFAQMMSAYLDENLSELKILYTL